MFCNPPYKDETGKHPVIHLWIEKAEQDMKKNLEEILFILPYEPHRGWCQEGSAFHRLITNKETKSMCIRLQFKQQFEKLEPVRQVEYPIAGFTKHQLFYYGKHARSANAILTSYSTFFSWK